MRRLILYHPHRQIDPIIRSLKDLGFLCINALNIWRLIPVKSDNIIKFKIISVILYVLRPRAVLTPNWISRYETFYKIWSDSHSHFKFLVVQHGGYVGGVVTSDSHRNVKCSHFLVWGDHFYRLFRRYNYNLGKEIIIFGNPVYNQKNREQFSYSNLEIKKILIVNSGVVDSDLSTLRGAIVALQLRGYIVRVKFHPHQRRKFGDTVGFDVEDQNLYQILENSLYDVYLVDHSTSLLDAIYFKQKVLFFPQLSRSEIFYLNEYSRFLSIISLGKLENSELSELVDVHSQEKLFQHMITTFSTNRHIGGIL